uniref:Uncharacterized protein n=1 Tax=Meloidogyne enterolobii TaxID=390850 RepID=A0A6V7VID3_MELEN|nr:unnamed protein product [Meloidogyne enterolobii]
MEGIKQDLKQKDEKINSLEVEIKKANDLTDKKFGDLFNFVSLLNNLVFVKIKNKWKEIDSYWNCCVNNCINTSRPIGNCVEGNGFVNLIDDENIKYLVGNGGKLFIMIDAFLFMQKIHSKNHKIVLIRRLYNEGFFQLSTFSWKNNDIFGCGLVYPPTNMANEFPYIFFTQNGEQIGKGVLLKDNFDSYKPRVHLDCCSVEANFGNNLESKPFKYDISKHLILKEFIEIYFLINFIIYLLFSSI